MRPEPHARRPRKRGPPTRHSPLCRPRPPLRRRERRQPLSLLVPRVLLAHVVHPAPPPDRPARRADLPHRSPHLHAPPPPPPPPPPEPLLELRSPTAGLPRDRPASFARAAGGAAAVEGGGGGGRRPRARRSRVLRDSAQPLGAHPAPSAGTWRASEPLEAHLSRVRAAGEASEEGGVARPPRGAVAPLGPSAAGGGRREGDVGGGGGG